MLKWEEIWKEEYEKRPLTLEGERYQSEKSYMLYVSNYDILEKTKLWRLKRSVIARVKMGERGVNRQKTGFLGQGNYPV